jgi:predicted esterase
MEAVKFLADACAKTDEALGRTDLVDYRGWLKFLRFEANFAAEHGGAASEKARAKAHRLAQWVREISANPNLLHSLSGVQEWAYESPVDDSGQPFKIAIPTDYDPSHPAPLSIYMHGSGGNHLEHSESMASHPGSFEMAVLGRARDGGYRALSEADVLQAVAYVESHWSIDLSRVSLRGGSMGGGGTYLLGSRFPQRWASGRASCGFASTIPMGNLVHLPIYAIHSADDPAVSILHERGPLALLRERGGQVVFDETNGYGHQVWNYKEGVERGAAWVKDKVRPDSRTIRQIDYTATDGLATRGWWADIAEWGPASGNARFVLTATVDNSLFADLTNITQLIVTTPESPLDRNLPLSVSVNGAVPITLPAPLPDRIVLVHRATGWDFEPKSERPPFRLHTPGSATLLYDGEPLLIVYGTGGTRAAQAAMRSAAEAASKSPNPSWPDEGGEAGSEGVPDSQNLYGHLKVKADTEVTASDMKRCHLVLIGTEEQNCVVRLMSGALPVHLSANEVSCSDGVRFSGSGLALGLVHFNPLSPGRLVFWIASHDPAAYRAKASIPLVMSGGGSFASNAFRADLLIMHAESATLVASRSFDSRWQWVKGRESSPVLGPAFSTSHGLSTRVASAIQRATGADLVLVAKNTLADSLPVEVGVTRVWDLAPLYANTPIGVMTVSGSELLAIADHASLTTKGVVLTGPDASQINPIRHYTVALPVNVLWAIGSIIIPPPRDYRLTSLDTGEVLEQYLEAP